MYGRYDICDVLSSLQHQHRVQAVCTIKIARRYRVGVAVNQAAPVAVYSTIVPRTRTVASKIVDCKTVVLFKCCSAKSSQDDVRVWRIVQRGVLGKKQACIVCSIRDDAADVVYLDAVREILGSK